MAKKELFTDKLLKLKKPLAFFLLIFCILIEYQLIKSIFFDGKNETYYVQSEFGFGSISDTSTFIVISILIIFFSAYLLQKKK